MIRDGFVPSWLSAIGVKPEHFTFTISTQKADEKGRFWLNSKAVRLRAYTV